MDGILRHESPLPPQGKGRGGEEESRLEAAHAERSIVFPTSRCIFNVTLNSDEDSFHVVPDPTARE